VRSWSVFWTGYPAAVTQAAPHNAVAWGVFAASQRLANAWAPGGNDPGTLGGFLTRVAGERCLFVCSAQTCPADGLVLVFVDLS
jgi:hypothetical protein